MESGGATVRLALEGSPPQESAHATLFLHGFRLLHRPPAPLSVFVNLPGGTAPALNSPFFLDTLNLFNFDLGTGSFMAHSEDAVHADHGAMNMGADLEFDVSAVLAAQLRPGSGMVAPSP